MADIEASVAGHIATITLNRPQQLNALTLSMLTGLHDAVWEAASNEEVRAIVLTGAGRGFCAGTDLVAMAAAAGEVASLATRFEPRQAPILALQAIDVPVVAAINGPAAGYGVGLALCADIRVMAADARLVPPTKRNLVPESGDTYLLPRLVGWEQAARFYFLGEEVEANEALRLGLVSEVADDAGATRRRAHELAARIAAMPPAGVQAAKRMLRAGREEPFADHVHHVLMQLLPLFQTEDFAEAVSAWQEKRTPRFSGR